MKLLSKGDKIICIDAGTGFTIGRIYTVLDVKGDDISYYTKYIVKNDQGIEESINGTLDNRVHQDSESMHDCSFEVYEINKNNNVEVDNMINNNMGMMNTEVGKINTNDVKLSMNGGIAVKTKDGKYVTYNKENNKLLDVSMFAFDCPNMIMKMPTMINQLVRGDLIEYNSEKVIVLENSGLNIFKILSMTTGEIKDVIHIENQFGMNFYIKYMSFMDMQGMNNPMMMGMMGQGFNPMMQMYFMNNMNLNNEVK